MFCRKCGTEIGDSRFCPSCGFNQAEGIVQGNGAPAQQPYYQQQPAKADMSVWDWVVVMLIMLIPIVGLVMLIVWAVDSSDKKLSRKNWAIAQLIVAAIIIIIFVVIFVVAIIFSSNK